MLKRDQTIIIKVSKEEKELLLSRAGEIPLSRFARGVLLSPANIAFGAVTPFRAIGRTQRDSDEITTEPNPEQL